MACDLDDIRSYPEVATTHLTSLASLSLQSCFIRLNWLSVEITVD